MASLQLGCILWCHGVLPLVAEYPLRRGASHAGSTEGRPVSPPGDEASSVCVPEDSFPKNGSKKLNQSLLAGSTRGRVSSTQAAPGRAGGTRHPRRPPVILWLRGICAPCPPLAPPCPAQGSAGLDAAPWVFFPSQSIPQRASGWLSHKPRLTQHESVPFLPRDHPMMVLVFLC